VSYKGNELIGLKISYVSLPEVVVRDLSAKEILKRTHEHLKKNYTDKHYQIEGFYREIQKADGRNVSLIEAASVIHSEGFHNPHREKYMLKQLRKSIGYANPYVPFWDSRNLLVAFLEQNFVKYKSRALIKYREAHSLEDTSIDGVLVYVILLSERPDFWWHTLYIRCDDFALIRYEETYNSETDPERTWKVDGNPLVQAYPKTKRFQVNFKLYDGKYYPDNYRMFFRAIYKDKMTGKDLLDFEISQQFVSTELFISNLATIPEEKVLHKDVSLKQIPANYDEKFWENYTVIRETPVDSLIRIDLEKQMKLEEQFKKN
jgi:hypothetical protein